MKQSTPLIQCPRCGGVGSVGLSWELRETLNWIQKHPGATTGQAHQADIKRGGYVSQTAFNARLEKLRELGLVNRERHGREWNYTAENHTPKAGKK